VGDSAPLPKLIKASDVVSRPINWLWPGWIAGGKLHIIGGAPGLAKTTIALAFAATISAGGRWPDGTRCAEQGDAVIWSGEDGIADTLKPRLEAMGANLEHVHFVGGIPDASGDRPFDPASDMRGLLHVLADLPTVRLVIVDPVVSAVAGDSHKNAEVRRGLQPLVDFGEKLGIAVIGITHFSKGTAGRDPLERLTGSIAFGALARLVFGAAKLKDEDGEEYRAFVRIKSNIGEDGGGFRYDVDYSDVGNGVIGSHILWGESIEGAAREILRDDSNAGDPDEQSAAGEARQFLESLLSDGPMRAGDVQKEGRGAGFSESAIRRAGDKLKVLRHKDGMRGGWVWTLPTKASTSPEGAEDVSLKRLTPTTPSATSSVIEVEI
jgi:putative DNA primase/helicase